MKLALSAGLSVREEGLGERNHPIWMENQEAKG